MSHQFNKLQEINSEVEKILGAPGVLPHAKPKRAYHDVEFLRLYDERREAIRIGKSDDEIREITKNLEKLARKKKDL